jgi:hypothetical protein
MPAIKPRLFFTGHTTELLGPPRVPKSVGEPCRQRVACRVWSTGSVENPAIQPRLLMLLPLADPPKDSRFVTSYVVCGVPGRSVPPASQRRRRAQGEQQARHGSPLSEA